MPETRNEFGQPIGAPLVGWTPPPFPPYTEMTGQYCRLVPLDPDAHGKDLFDAFGGTATGKADWTYLPYGPFQDFAAFSNWLKHDCTNPDPQFYTIIDSRTNQPAGVTSYLRIQPKAGSIEVGHIHYGTSLQKTAAATETMYLMMARAFDELRYRRYEWKCDSLNAPSRKAAERLGFTFEGIFRQATVYKERTRDTAWYSILDSEWPQIKQAFQHWLSKENFDSAHRQRQSLTDFMEKAGIAR